MESISELLSLSAFKSCYPLRLRASTCALTPAARFHSVLPTLALIANFGYQSGHPIAMNPTARIYRWIHREWR
ncbi:MAG: hypothetical protein CMN76_17100 [Spirochaetaceae bacterium]|nr:hypothetical protein [Spirochaetaceae bacterium]